MKEWFLFLATRMCKSRCLMQNSGQWIINGPIIYYYMPCLYEYSTDKYPILCSVFSHVYLINSNHTCHIFWMYEILRIWYLAPSYNEINYVDMFNMHLDFFVICVLDKETINFIIITVITIHRCRVWMLWKMDHSYFLMISVTGN